jgi:hypothetical protein
MKPTRRNAPATHIDRLGESANDSTGVIRPPTNPSRRKKR